MNDKQEQKLITLLKERSKKIESIRNFDEYFQRFAHYTLKNVVNNVNQKLGDFTNESLRLFFEDPYELKRSQYFVMVQLISEHNRRSHFFLDNTRHYPSLIFEGDDISGNIKITTKIKENAWSSSEKEVSLLTEDFVFDILIKFLDEVYKI